MFPVLFIFPFFCPSARQDEDLQNLGVPVGPILVLVVQVDQSAQHPLQLLDPNAGPQGRLDPVRVGAQLLDDLAFASAPLAQDLDAGQKFNLADEDGHQLDRVGPFSKLRLQAVAGFLVVVGQSCLQDGKDVLGQAHVNVPVNQFL